MKRYHVQLLTLASVMFVPAIGWSQALVSPSLQEKPTQESTAVKELVIHAADQPDPMLRYRFWPDAGQRKSENATPLVSRAIILELQVSPEIQKRFAERFEQWNEMPIDELPVEEVRALLENYRAALQELERSELLMQTDYPLQLEEMSTAELIQTLLPELQEMRNLARLIGLRARLAVREERWDDMVHDCRVGFRLAEVAGHSTDFLIGRLVGFAIASTMMDVIETAIQQPGCPNLYWALVSLPAERLFETGDSLEFESVLISRVFHGVGQLPDQPIGPLAAREKFRTIVDQMNKTLLGRSGDGNPPQPADLLGGAYVVMMADPSRDLLAATPQWGERAYELSAPEAVLRATILKFSRARDRWVAWSMLPPETWEEYEAESQAAVEVEIGQTDLLVALIGMLTPAVNAARTAGRRSEQMSNWLMTIEAIRMHAARTGELPASLHRLRPVPAWPDTIANEPFGYQRSTTHRATLTRAPRYPSDRDTTFQIQLRGTK
jgi:hypothetical protein